MKFISTIALIMAFSFASQATGQSFTGKNTKSADPLKELKLSIYQNNSETTIKVSGIENVLQEAEKRFKYVPKYLDCLNCNKHKLEVVYEIIGEYTFGGHS